jgi:hypothetical protein
MDEVLIPAVSPPGSRSRQQLLQQQGDIDASSPKPYTRSDHFSYLGLGREEQTWYSIDWTKSLMPMAAPSAAAAEEGAPNTTAAATQFPPPGSVKEFCVTLPDAKLRTVFVGLPEHHARIGIPASSVTDPNEGPMGGSVPPSSSLSPPERMGTAQPLPVRTVTMRIRGDVLCGAVMDALAHALVPSNASSNPGDGDDYRADVTAEVTSDLSTSSGPMDDAAATGSGAAIASTSSLSPGTTQVHIQKRQGGHLQAIVGGTRVSTVRRRRPQSIGMEDDVSISREEEIRLVTDSTTKSCPPFFLDAQMVTHKSELCERVLLVRVYHLHDPESYQYEMAAEVDGEIEPYLEPDPAPDRGQRDDDDIMVRQQDVNDVFHLRQCLQLREACAMIQRVESPRKVKRIRVPASKLSNSNVGLSPSQQVFQETVSDHLLQHYLACPSVKEGNITLPSLNPQDWPVVVASWPWIKVIWDELESRDLSYPTLLTSRFGDFPALPTLDMHYCSQIRRLSREEMVAQLLKSASELEEYAREAEYACANMISLLQPTFEAYGIDPPALPKPTPLTAYPLNFVAPQQTCPPWGLLVMEALNQVQAWTKDGEDAAASSIWDPGASLSLEEATNSIEMAEKAVHLVLAAFQKQDDEEKGARLGRKNMQVMDRLAKMQEHERQSILMLSRSHLACDKASRAADDFAAKSGGVREVPLLKWSIVVGGATGTCLVTANHILFVTQLIPYIGGSKSSLFRLQDVDFSVQDAGTPSLLNPLPTIISVKRHGVEVYSFRPSSGGARLKSVLDLLQSIDVEATSL